MPEPTLISAITTCKGRLAHLKATLPRLIAEPFAEVIVVDYDCPEATGDWVAAEFPAARLVRVQDAPIFHVARARNLGAAVARAPWLLFVDADVRLAPGFLAAAADRLAPGVFVVASPPAARDLTGTMFVSRADFEAVGGYDEAIQGWGSEDEDLVDQLELLGRRQACFDAATAAPIPHEDELRTRHHQIKDAALGNEINFLYRIVKRDLFRQGQSLDLRTRQAIHAQVASAYLSTEGPRSIEVHFQRFDLAAHRVTKSLRYEFETPRPPG